MLDLEAIEARAEAATPGPWKLGDEDKRDIYSTVGRKHFIAGLCRPGGDHVYADAEFIAHAREDVPALIARVEALEAENATLRTHVEEAKDFLSAYNREEGRGA